MFQRWDLTDASTIAPLFPEGERCGIYVLEFADGERYVGQAKNVVSRYSQHRHGSGQHEPWEDVTAIRFLPVPESDLNVVELATIREHSQQVKLRNKAHNHGHWQPTPLDEFIEPSQQRHWATGQPEYSIEDFKGASRLKGEAPRLLTSRRGQEVQPDGRSVWETVVDELAQAVALAIPNALETEGRYWMISDYPSTARGRFATLNVGTLELMFFPRTRFTPEVGNLEASRGLLSVLNADIETFIPFSDLEGEFAEDEDVSTVGEINGHAIEMERSPKAYSVPVDRIWMPLGIFGVQALDPEQLAGVRRLAIHAMRNGSARVNSRSRNERLTRMVYKRIAAPDFLATSSKKLASALEPLPSSDGTRTSPPPFSSRSPKHWTAN